MTGNPVQRSMTKHISTRYHFNREYVMNGTIEMYFVLTYQQLTYIFIKHLCEATFTRLVTELGMISFVPHKSTGLNQFLVLGGGGGVQGL